MYDLLATVGHVQDFKSGGNLVAHIHVGTTYHSRKEVRTLLTKELCQSLSSFMYCPHNAREISKAHSQLSDRADLDTTMGDKSSWDS